MNTIEIDLASNKNQKWYFRPDSSDWKSIRVPYGGYRNQGFDCDRGEYKTILNPLKFRPDSVIKLCFEGVNFACEIFIGQFEGSLVKVGEHIGGWLPFEVDLSSHIKPGETYHLLVRVRGRNDLRHDRSVASWDWTGDFKTSTVKQFLVPEAAPWQTQLEDGIIRGVSLKILPHIYLSDPFVVTSVKEGTFQPFVTLSNRSSSPIQGLIEATITEADGVKRKYTAIPSIPISLNAHDECRFDLNASVWGLGCESFWWPNVPYRSGFKSVLHKITYRIKVGNKILHNITTRFGFREFSWKGNCYYLNGIKCNLRGDNQTQANFGTDTYGVHPGFGPPRKGNPGWPAAVDTLQRLNFNALRIHQVPPTRYMLDVCDEMGLMIIDETPIRGSEGLEDFVGGWENMLNCAKELAKRDRNHPSVIIWSAANEIWGNRPLALALQGAIWSVDWTRPVIIDGVSDLGPEIINMTHYAGGLGIFPEAGGDTRTDRPFGETECIWPMDNALQGFAWMATSTRHRRLKGNADIRNYVLNNAFPNYILGHGRDQQYLEKKIKDIRWQQVTSGMEILPDIKKPWEHPNIILMQQCFNPCTACDLKYDRENRLSDASGSWPTHKLELPRNQTVRRMLAVFNDTFEGDRLTLQWKTVINGRTLESSSLEFHVPFGDHIKTPIQFKTPDRAGELQLVLNVLKGKNCIYKDESIVFQLK